MRKRFSRVIRRKVNKVDVKVMDVAIEDGVQW